MQRHKKRILLILLIFCMTFTGSGCAEDTVRSIWESLGFGAEPAATETVTPSPEPTATPAPEDFRFRDGIRWGMSMQQVKALEQEEMLERSNQDWSIMVTREKVAVSRFTADLVFMFRQDRLKMITYEFQRQDAAADFQYLTGALISIYGEKQDADPLMIKTFMDAINPGRYQLDRIREACAWIRNDGTAVFLYYYDQDAFSIMYTSPELAGGLYQTTGL